MLSTILTAIFMLGTALVVLGLAWREVSYVIRRRNGIR